MNLNLRYFTMTGILNYSINLEATSTGETISKNFEDIEDNVNK